MAPPWGRTGRTRRSSLPGITFEKALLLVILSLTLLVYLMEHRYLLVHSDRSKAFGGAWGSGPSSRFTQNSGEIDKRKSIMERIDADDEEFAVESTHYPKEMSEGKRSQTNHQVSGTYEYHLTSQGTLDKRDTTTEKTSKIKRAYAYGEETVIQGTHGAGQMLQERSSFEPPGPSSSNDGASSHHPPHENGTRSVKVVELHTPLYNNLSWKKHLRGAFDLRQCPETRCKFVFYSDHYPDPDALVFHAPHIRKEAFPAIQKPNQIYIMMSLEATGLHPQNGDMAKLLKNGDGDSLFFDWTMTFHRYADVQLTYGHFRSRRGESMGLYPGLLDSGGSTFRGYIEALNQNDLRQETKPEAQLEKLWWRPRMVAWLVSHCNTESGREFYVKELKRHLPVDTFGGCGHLTCGSNEGGDCYKNVLRPKYKFYLAFENNMCEDYVSEKPFRAMLNGMVPVVFGGANYSLYLPPGSYIDATSLDPPTLAQVILEAASTRERYGRFHLWRRFWKVGLFPPLCQLCAKLHSSSSHLHSTHHPYVPHRFRLPNPLPLVVNSSTLSSSGRNFEANAIRGLGTIVNASSVPALPRHSSNPMPVLPNSLSSSYVVPPPRRTLTKVWMWWVKANKCFTLYPEDKYFRTAQASSVVLKRLAPAGGLLGSLGKWLGALLGDNKGQGQVKGKGKGNG